MKKIFLITSVLAVASAVSAATGWTGANDTDFVTVGNVGNSGRGAVSYEYSIGKYEVTNSQYMTFMNAVGALSVSVKDTSTYLYSEFGIEMTTYGYGIKTSDNKTFTLRDAVYGGDKPVNGVNAYAAAMYTNWLSNGAKTTDVVANDYLSGVYDFNTYGLTIDVFKKAVKDGSAGKYMLPSDSQWHKAAYYSPDLNDGAGGYYSYACQSDTVPTATLVPNGQTVSGANLANYASVNSANNYTSAVGSYVDSMSYYGTFDQNGNVSEWTDTYYGTKLYLRDASAMISATAMNASKAIVSDAASSDQSDGFRVVSIVSAIVSHDLVVADDGAAVATINKTIASGAGVDATSTVEVKSDTETTPTLIMAFDTSVIDSGKVVSVNTVKEITTQANTDIASAEVISAFEFDVSNENNANLSVTLSFFVGEGVDGSTLSVYHKSNGSDAWGLYDTAIDVKDGYASFVVTDLARTR